MEKLTLKEFRKIKKELLELENKFISDPENHSYITFKKNYQNILNKLFIFNLSNVPFSEWEGIYILPFKLSK